MQATLCSLQFGDIKSLSRDEEGFSQNDSILGITVAEDVNHPNLVLFSFIDLKANIVDGFVFIEFCFVMDASFDVTLSAVKFFDGFDGFGLQRLRQVNTPDLSAKGIG